MQRDSVLQSVLWIGELSTMPGDSNTFVELCRELQAVYRQIGDALDRLDDIKDKVRQLAKQQGGAAAPAASAIPAATDNPAILADESAAPPPIVRFVMLERQLDGGFLLQIGEKDAVRISKSF